MRILYQTEATATGGRATTADGSFIVALPGIEANVARELPDQAHVVCPYSHATRGGLEVRLSLTH